MYRKEIHKIFKEESLIPLRQLGQNFLLDQNVINKIIEAAELTDSDTVLEIGTGLGQLTAALAAKAGKVISIEKDKKMATLAQQRFAANKDGPCNVEFIHADALKFNPLRFTLHASRYKLVANLPYSITGAFFRKFLNFKIAPSLVVVMIQKEVTSTILKKEPPFDLLGIITQFYGQTSLVTKVHCFAFWPQPKVDSAVIKLVIKKNPILAKLEHVFMKLTRAGFGQRRKTLLNALSHGLKKQKTKILSLLNDTGIDFSCRAEQLSLTQWISLAAKAKRLKV